MPRSTRVFEVADRKGISQAELARLTGIPEATLSRIRRGEREVSLLFMDRVLATLPDWATEEDLFPLKPEQTAS